MTAPGFGGAVRARCATAPDQPGVFFAADRGLLLGVPGLGRSDRSHRASERAWIAVGSCSRMLSCRSATWCCSRLGFGRLGRSLQLAPVACRARGQLGRVGERPGGHRVGAWVAAQQGSRSIGSRSARCWCSVMTSAVNVGAVIVIGVRSSRRRYFAQSRVKLSMTGRGGSESGISPRGRGPA